MRLDPYLAERIRLLDGLESWEPGDPGEASRIAEFGRDPRPWTLPDVEVRDDVVPGPRGDVEVRRYRPAGGAIVGRLVWAHGGGFSRGDLDMPESHVVSAELAVRARHEVVAVGYRLATRGTRFPVPLDDVAAVWEHESRADALATSLGGASAGASLALATAIRARDTGAPTPSVLLLAYPLVHHPVPALADDLRDVVARLPRLFRFDAALIEELYAGYVGRIAALPPLAVPGHSPLHGLPPVHLIASELDELRPSAELLLRQLREAGSAAELYLARGMPHGHLNRTPSLSEVDRSLDVFAAALGLTRPG